MSSLRNRLTLSLSLLMIVAGALLAVGLQHFPRELVDRYVLSRLEHDADLLYARIRDAADPERAAEEAAGTVYRLPLSGHYFRITHASRTIRSRSLWDEDLHPAPASVHDGVSRRPGPDGQALLIYAKTYPGGGPPAAAQPDIAQLGIAQPVQTATAQPATAESAGGVPDPASQAWFVEVAEDVSAVDVAIAGFRRALLAGGLLALLALVLVQRRLLVRGLAPLDGAVEACRRLERGETVPIAVSAPAEVRPMLEAVNRLAHHQGRRLGRIRHAAGNLSHALKTPLAVLGQLADGAAESGDAALAATLRDQLAAMRATIERELSRARLAGGGPPAEGFDAATQLAALSEGLERLHRDRGIAIEVDVPPRLYPFDREDMLELFGNLLDNACKWARSRVRLVVHSGDADTLHFTIEDDGPGVVPELIGRLGHPGFRTDEQRPGHGVGLAIVADIVAQYDGEIDYGRSGSLGGLRVDGWLPTPHAD